MFVNIIHFPVYFIMYLNLLKWPILLQLKMSLTIWHQHLCNMYLNQLSNFKCFVHTQVREITKTSTNLKYIKE